jgi:hypothetical protein
MALSALGRKHLLEHGVQHRIALRLSVSDAFVSSVVRGEERPATRDGWKTYRRVQREVAKALSLRVVEAFSAWERGVVAEPEMATAQ